jgi:hypothetical protein
MHRTSALGLTAALLAAWAGAATAQSAGRLAQVGWLAGAGSALPGRASWRSSGCGRGPA